MASSLKRPASSNHLEPLNVSPLVFTCDISDRPLVLAKKYAKLMNLEHLVQINNMSGQELLQSGKLPNFFDLIFIGNSAF